MDKDEDVKEHEDDYQRVVAILSSLEKKKLQVLAWRSGRSMSGYIRHLVNEDYEANGR